MLTLSLIFLDIFPTNKYNHERIKLVYDDAYNWRKFDEKVGSSASPLPMVASQEVDARVEPKGLIEVQYTPMMFVE